MTFKVGDKVRLVQNNSHSVNLVGDQGVITHYDSYRGYRVSVEGTYKGYSPNWSPAADLELVTEEPWSAWAIVRSGTSLDYDQWEFEQKVVDANTVALRRRLKAIVEPVYTEVVVRGHWDTESNEFYPQPADQPHEFKCTITVTLKDGIPVELKGGFE